QLSPTFFFSLPVRHPNHHSSPTRRSSDLENADAPSAPSHHTAFEVDDIDAAHQYMQGKGVVPTAIQTRNDGQKAFYINDPDGNRDRKSTRLNSSHVAISYAVFCLKKKKT